MKARIAVHYYPTGQTNSIQIYSAWEDWSDSMIQTMVAVGMDADIRTLKFKDRAGDYVILRRNILENSILKIEKHVT